MLLVQYYSVLSAAAVYINYNSMYIQCSRTGPIILGYAEGAMHALDHATESALSHQLNWKSGP